jgi:integral membrane sensor domain MASE1
MLWGRRAGTTLPISTNGLAAAATAAGNALAPLVAATLLSKIGFHRQIDRLRDATAIVFVGAPLEARLEDALAQCDCGLPDDLA